MNDSKFEEKLTLGSKNDMTNLLNFNDDDDNDDDDDDDELFLSYGWPTKGVQSYFQLELLSEILTISNLRHAESRIWICAEPEFRLC